MLYFHTSFYTHKSYKSKYRLYRILIKANIRKNKVSEREACAMVHGIWQEIQHLPGVQNISSARFLQAADRLAQTSHENRLGTAMEDFGLSANIPVSYVDVTMTQPHPVLGVRSFVESLSSEKQIDRLFCGHDETDFADFWRRFQTVQPQHPVFTQHRKRLGRVIPIWAHADEGTSQKKRAIMILQWQPLCIRYLL